MDGFRVGAGHLGNNTLQAGIRQLLFKDSGYEVIDEPTLTFVVRHALVERTNKAVMLAFPSLSFAAYLSSNLFLCQIKRSHYL